jgi:pimeloyl-ACP methyl ester carboxylesterase
MQPYPGLEPFARTVTLPGGLDLFLFDTGGDPARPVVVLLHGLGDEADTWRQVIPALRADYRVLAPDLPGFGRSGLPNRPLTVPFFAETILALLSELQIEQVVLSGHSTGAIIAHHLALTHPERVKRLVLIGGSLLAGKTRLNAGLLLFLIPGLGERTYTGLRRDPQAAYRSLEGYYHRLADLPAAERDFLFQRVNQRVWSDQQRKGFFSTFRNLARWLPAQQKGLPEQLRGWEIPTRLVWGEHDGIVPASSAAALQALIPNAELTLVTGAGHNVQQEQPEAVIAAIAG